MLWWNQGKDGYNEAVLYGNSKVWRWLKFGLFANNVQQVDWSHVVGWCLKRTGAGSIPMGNWLTKVHLENGVCVCMHRYYILGTCEASRFDSISNRTSDSGFDSY